MRVTGLGVGFIDVAAEHTADYNRWYDLDHVPENLALAEVTGARRYVATPDCKAARPPVGLPELADGGGAYFTTYLFNTDDLAAAAASWHELGDRLRKQRRFFRHGRVPYSGIYRLDDAVARADIPVAAEAIPHLGHTGVLVALTQVADPARRAEVDRWFHDFHAPDLLSVPGVMAALRFSRLESPDNGGYMNLYLLESDPAAVIAEVTKRSPEWRERGTAPSPGNASKSVFFGPYRQVTPLQYNFEIA